MSERSLWAHRSALPRFALAVVARAERDGATLSLRYRLTGDLAEIALAPAGHALRADRLWERTCFEAFVAVDDADHYVEINLAPSTEWAVYAFDGYRRGMRQLPVEPPPAVHVIREAQALTVTGSVDLRAWSTAPSAWRIGLAAVVAATDGAKSYWALRHEDGPPDFHSPAGFDMRLAETVT